MKLAKILKRFRIDKPDKFRLADHDCAETGGLDIEKAEAKAMLAHGIERLSQLQEKLYAQDRWSVLIVFQAMDAAGKDSAIKHVMSGVNPQGCEVFAFKHPSAEELNHDFLWRIAKDLPERGRIGIFNRSHYEDVLIARVHPEVLASQRLPRQLVSKDLWDERFKSIRGFERHLARNGTLLLKFFLHVSKEEQRKRFLARLDEPAKRWKFAMSDVAERRYWDRYMHAYEEAIRHTSRPEAPWYVIPADDRSFARLAIAEVIVEAMEELKLDYPKVQGKALQELERVRRALVAEAPKRK
ncbi:MAG TPA: polyphosphate kinase 2 family protein [Xanthobacteraceae bacterium]|nr:polyphosphate kinase 2 family protein [Xanthobacteraceae bacterium]